jgi:hypothetical protein
MTTENDEQVPLAERITKLKERNIEMGRAAMTHPRTAAYEEIKDNWEEALAIIHELLAINRECQERCICQCPMDQHENYGEDGFACGEGHECLLASTAVCALIDEQAARIAKLEGRLRGFDGLCPICHKPEEGIHCD